ncbi:hypothetical protein [Natronoglycomyces albus]|uniref:Uncharacterized protein n=1 Tax=Natronoglycomyces albus TaxID=2811108 RepID=A0A895XP42_9ACTN|nr:hypothetical protein [Natronoglycomyces albus]QSB05313.1 hypothetical protein JQS30_16445 [Natronoglycomyces albus]
MSNTPIHSPPDAPSKLQRSIMRVPPKLWYVAIALGVVLFVVAAVVPMSSAMHERPYEHDLALKEASSDESGPEGLTEVHSSDGEIEVVEFGYSTTESSSWSDRLYWGTVLKNSSEEYYAAVTIDIRVLYEVGSDAMLSNAERLPNELALAPGEQVSLGNNHRIGSADIFEVDVLTSVTWLEPRGDVFHLRSDRLEGPIEVAIDNVRTTDDHVTYDLSVEREGTYVTSLWVSGVLRDSGGDIVGGFGPNSSHTISHVPPGVSQRSLVIDDAGMPPNVDHDQTELELY